MSDRKACLVELVAKVGGPERREDGGPCKNLGCTQRIYYKEPVPDCTRMFRFSTRPRSQLVLRSPANVFNFQPSIASAFIPFACAIILWQQHCDFRFPDFKDYLESFCFLILQTDPLTGGLENIPLCCGPRSYFKIFY